MWHVPLQYFTDLHVLHIMVYVCTFCACANIEDLLLLFSGAGQGSRGAWQRQRGVARSVPAVP